MLRRFERERFEGSDWGRKMGSNVRLFEPCKIMGGIGEMSERHFQLKPSTQLLRVSPHQTWVSSRSSLEINYTSSNTILMTEVRWASCKISCLVKKFKSPIKTRKRAIAKALHLKGRTTSHQSFWRIMGMFWVFFEFFLDSKYCVFGRLVYFGLATHVVVATPTAQVK